MRSQEMMSRLQAYYFYYKIAYTDGLSPSCFWGHQAVFEGTTFEVTIPQSCRPLLLVIVFEIENIKLGSGVFPYLWLVCSVPGQGLISYSCCIQKQSSWKSCAGKLVRNIIGKICVLFIKFPANIKNFRNEKKMSQCFLLEDVLPQKFEALSEMGSDGCIPPLTRTAVVFFSTQSIRYTWLDYF